MRDMLPSNESPHLEPVLKDYESAFKIALRLHHPSRPVSKIRQEPGFHLHLFAVPGRFTWLSFLGDTPMLTLPIAFGHPLHDAARLTLLPPRRGAKGMAVRDDEGRALAYLHNRNIFVLFDLAGQTEDLAALLLRHLLDRAFELMPGDLAAQSGLHPERIRLILSSLRKATELHQSNWREARRALARSRFQEGRWERIADEIGFLEPEIRSTEEALEAGSLRLTAETRHLQACRRRLHQLRGDLVEGEVNIDRELDRLHQLPDVADVTSSASGLRIITRPIRGEHRGKLHALGTFQIDLSYNGEITIRNLTSRHGYYDHPHIWDGNPCLGNIREGLSKLIGELQLATASAVLLDFLKTINPRDWHVSIEHWREMPRPGHPDVPVPGTLKTSH